MQAIMRGINFVWSSHWPTLDTTAPFSMTACVAS
jgi:hypothetical protein